MLGGREIVIGAWAIKSVDGFRRAKMISPKIGKHGERVPSATYSFVRTRGMVVAVEYRTAREERASSAENTGDRAGRFIMQTRIKNKAKSTKNNLSVATSLLSANETRRRIPRHRWSPRFRVVVETFDQLPHETVTVPRHSIGPTPLVVVPRTAVRQLANSGSSAAVGRRVVLVAATAAAQRRRVRQRRHVTFGHPHLSRKLLVHDPFELHASVRFLKSSYRPVYRRPVNSRPRRRFERNIFKAPFGTW